jgi:hypothetical protein
MLFLFISTIHIIQISIYLCSKFFRLLSLNEFDLSPHYYGLAMIYCNKNAKSGSTFYITYRTGVEMAFKNKAQAPLQKKHSERRPAHINTILFPMQAPEFVPTCTAARSHSNDVLNQIPVASSGRSSLERSVRRASPALI